MTHLPMAYASPADSNAHRAASAKPNPDRRNPASRVQILRCIRTEFQEPPTLRLTFAQARRLFGLPQDVCDRVLAELVREQFLAQGMDGRYEKHQPTSRGPLTATAASSPPQGSDHAVRLLMLLAQRPSTASGS